MVVLTHIIVALVTYLVARQFWACIKRRGYISQALRDVALLQRLVTREALRNVDHAQLFSQAEPKAFYPLKIQALAQADQAATNKIKFVSGLILLVIAIGAYFATPYTLITFAVFTILASFGPLSRVVKNNAHVQALQLAVVIDKWRCEDAAGCESFFNEAVALRPLYNVVKTIS
jgi:hypothetical protein